jgi:Cu(I)/Ag(I) efflux system membrane protein CusA/SilA
MRSFSFFGDSYVYVVFGDRTAFIEARTRVLEYLGQITRTCHGVSRRQAGCTGVGWIYNMR